jgi:hypothetical protein
MGRIVVSEFITVDGVVEDPGRRPSTVTFSSTAALSPVTSARSSPATALSRSLLPGWRKSRWPSTKTRP